LLESVVYPERIAREIAGSASSGSPGAGQRAVADAAGRTSGGRARLAATTAQAGAAHEWAALRDVMYSGVGVERDAAGLTWALERLQQLADRSSSDELRDAALVGSLVARAALRRRETRGSHTRTDFPSAVSAERHRSFSTLEEIRAQAPSREARTA
jgi:L-aspartate oxidase